MSEPDRKHGQAEIGEGGLGRFRYEYGAQPLHLIAVAGSLLLSGYGLLRITELPGAGRIFIWLLVAALLHDLVALPLYSVLLRIAHGAAGRAIESRAAMLLALNHVRIPAAISALLLLIYFPLILRIDPESYEATTGIGLDPYLGRWLLISAALFLGSGVIYALRLRRDAGGGGGGAAGAAAPPREDAARPAPLPWRIAGRLVLAASALAILWVAAALVVGLLDSGL